MVEHNVVEGVQPGRISTRNRQCCTSVTIMQVDADEWVDADERLREFLRGRRHRGWKEMRLFGTEIFA
jgi:hypothetical protein